MHKMNTCLVKSVPPGEFSEVSVLRKDWQTQFQMLVGQRRPIKYDFYPLPKMPQEVRQQLEEKGYREMILEWDRWQHFLVPNTN
jgi:hypothetical protein